MRHHQRAGALVTAAMLLAAAATLLPVAASAQPGREHGQSITPVYEGYVEKPDGSFELLFGYLNRNWVEQPVVEVGPGNFLDPGGPDLGQPTHFFPRRNRFVFRVPVPADFGRGEVVWTLTVNGVTAQAFGTLRQGYAVDDTVLMANFGGGGQGGFRPDTVGNRAPVLTVETDRELTAAVGEPVLLRAVATDDGKPTRRPIPDVWIGRTRSVLFAATGLRLSWMRYRGPAPVAFDPPQTKVWEDFRDGGGSPWSAGWEPPPIPPDNRWVVRATFTAPGTYVLRCVAHDGGLQAYEDVTVRVRPRPRAPARQAAGPR